MSGKKKLNRRSLKSAVNLLQKVTEILERHNIQYWLESGTLLGIIRENRLLPWDTDLDLSIKEEDVNKLISIRYKFWLRGYKTYIAHQRKDDTPLVKGNVKILKIFNSVLGHILLDIFVKTKYKNRYYWSVGGKKKYIKKRAPAHFYENLITKEFNEKNYYIPAQYEKYLTYRYGNWKKTVKDWNIYVDDKAIVTH